MLKNDRRVEIQTLERGDTFFNGNSRGQRVESSTHAAAEYLDGETRMIRVVEYDDYGVPSIKAYPEGWTVTVRP